MDKNSLRQYIREEKKRHSKSELLSQSEIILSKLENNEHFIEAKNIMLYASLPDEVYTLDFIEKWRNKKHIILPVVLGDDIIPTALEDEVSLAKGSFNIPEPQNNPYKGNFDLIIVPGMAFDKQGNRLGRGKGYYDRFLVNNKNVYKIGICFDFQFLDVIPSEDHDQKIDEIITVL